MRKNCFLLLYILFSPIALFSQTQISVGGIATTEVFNDVKYDASDGSTINVGTIGVSGVGTGTDCYLVKLNAAKQIVWQKTIVNAGNDFLSKVRICANGDYIASGEFTQNGLQWGIVCRIKSATGNIIWSTTSIGTASQYGDQFYNLMETANGDIAVVGSTDFISGPINSMVVLLSSGGIQKWCRIADFNSSDEIQTVNQLPNGNLIICGHYYEEFTRYIAFVMELDEPTGSIINKTDYAVNMADPLMSGNTLNTLWPANGFVTNGNVMFEIGLTYGCCGPGSNIALCTYDQTTKALTCNLYYHKGYPNSGSDAVTVLNTNDYLIAEAIAKPGNIENLYVTRVTNGTVVYDRRVSTTDTYINAIDINGSNIFLSGADKQNSGDGYSLYSTTAFPGSTGSCIFPDADSLIVLPITPVQTADTIALNSVSGVMIPLTLIATPVSGIVTTLCGCVPDSSIIDTTICQGQNYLGHSTAGTYIDTLMNVAGCDSIRKVNLTINNNCVSSKQCSGATHIIWKDDFGNGVPINKGIDQDINPAYLDINNGVGPGSYAVLNFFNYQTCCWHKVTQDHTGNAGGYFLVVDGGVPNFYSTRVANVCPNTNYTFSAWSMNMDLLAYPSLTTFIFNITDTLGNVLGQLATAPITVQSSPTWVNNGFTFNTGSNTALKLNLILTSSGNNDFAFDDLELSVCGPTLNLVPTVSACSSKVEITANLGSGYSNPVYHWYKQDSDSTWVPIVNATSSNYTDSLPAANNWYKATVSDGASACSYIEDSIQVIFAKPVPDTITIDSTICNGQSAYGHTIAGIYSLDTIHNSSGCDSVVRILNLSVNNCVVTSSCQGAMVLHGDDEGLLPLPDTNYYSANGFTWECWFYSDWYNNTNNSLGYGQSLMMSEDPVFCEDIDLGFGWSTIPRNALGFNVDGPGECGNHDNTPCYYVLPGGFQPATWYQVAAVKDYISNTTSLYLNGILVDTKPNTKLPFTRDITTRLGTQPVGGDSSFNGKMDEIRIWNYPRTAAQINANYNQCLTGNEPGLVVYYRANEAAGSIAHDATPNHRDAILDPTVAWDKTTNAPLINSCGSSTTSTIDTSICQGQNYLGYDTAGTYIDTLTNVTGCDSIRTLILTVNPYKTDSVVQTICQPQSFIIGTHTYSATGIYHDTLSTITCDSIVILNLTVNSCNSPRTVCARDTVDRSICEGDSLVFNGKMYNGPGAYSDTLAIAACDSIVTLSLTVNPNPSVHVFADSSEVAKGGIVQLNATPSLLSYMWTSTNALLDNSLIQNPVAIINDASWIFLEASDPLTNCKGNDSVFIAVRIQVPCNGVSHIYIPSAFTPNNDGLNDLFRIKGDNIILNEFEIFNRWGEMVFETKDISQGWDGAFNGEILNGNYVYWISYKECSDNDSKVLKGNVVLLR